MIKKIIFISMILLSLIGLSACNSTDDGTAIIAVNDPTPDKLVYTLAESPNVTSAGGVSYFVVNKEGTVKEEVILTNYNTYEGQLEGVRTYTFLVDNQTLEFQIYYIPTDLGANPDEIVMLAFRFEEQNFRLRKGEDFNPEGMIIYAVQKDGDITELKGEDYALNFDDGGYDPLGSDGFKNKETFEVTFTYEGISKSFNVYTAGGENPISTKDASFFDWILVIPVAFVMNLIASIMGNSFALGILFTTIIVRTLAWPIYAKSNDMSIKMNLAQPDMQRVQAKFAGRKDPQSQQMMQMEMLQVYKKHGINLLGCLFPFLQMPIFIAMYGVVRRITLEGGMYASNVNNTMVFGFIDLSQVNSGGPFNIIGGIMAGIVGLTMYILQKISMKKPSYAKNTASHNPNPQAAQTEKTMKFVSYFMIIIMVIASYSTNALAFYWIIGNIFSLGQTLVNRKMNEKKHERLRQKQLMG